MKSLSSLLLVSACLFSVASAASATPLAAGGTVAATPVTTSSTQVLASFNNVAFTSQAPAGMASTFSGTYSTAVYKDSTNTLCASAGNCLTFAIQVMNSSASADGIETVTTGPFSSLFTYNVGYVALSGGMAPLVIKDSASGTISFNFTVGTNWANMIMPGSQSDSLIIQTSAMNYAPGNISFQDSQTATVAGFLPVAVTPEPSSLILLGSGMVGAATTLLRRKRFLL